MQSLVEKFGWQRYPQKHFESRFTRFYEGYWLPTQFGFDTRRVQFSSLILTGQMTREEALASSAEAGLRPGDDRPGVRVRGHQAGHHVEELRGYHDCRQQDLPRLQEPASGSSTSARRRLNARAGAGRSSDDRDRRLRLGQHPGHRQHLQALEVAASCCPRPRRSCAAPTRSSCPAWAPSTGPWRARAIRHASSARRPGARQAESRSWASAWGCRCSAHPARRARAGPRLDRRPTSGASMRPPSGAPAPAAHGLEHVEPPRADALFEASDRTAASTSCTRTTSTAATRTDVLATRRLRRALRLRGAARQRLRRAVPSREEPRTTAWQLLKNFARL